MITVLIIWYHTSQSHKRATNVIDEIQTYTKYTCNVRTNENTNIYLYYHISILSLYLKHEKLIADMLKTVNYCHKTAVLNPWYVYISFNPSFLTSCESCQRVKSYWIKQNSGAKYYNEKQANVWCSSTESTSLGAVSNRQQRADQFCDQYCGSSISLHT